MRRTAFSFPTIFFLCAALTAAAAVEVIDDRGAALRLEHPAQRMISLAPHLTELIFAVGGGSRLVGVVRGSDYPSQALAIVRIGDAAGLDFERVIALQPDLVLAWGSGNRVSDIERLERLGYKVLVLEPRRLTDIPRHLRLLGALAGTKEQAEAAAQAFSAHADVLRGRRHRVASLNVLFEVWHHPLMTVNGKHLISDVLELCGARNVFADLPQLAGAVSLEQVLIRDPDAIVVGSEAVGGPEDWQGYASLRAVRSKSVFTVSADLIARQTPRILDAAEKICADLVSVGARF